MANLSQYLNALKNLITGADLGGRGITSQPGYVKLKDTAGVAYYLYVSTAGKLTIRFATVPDGGSGTVVGAQS